MTNFLPNNYEIPSNSGRYMKLVKGENRFRILDSPIIGNEYWNLEGKPVRLRPGDTVVPDAIRPNKDGSPASLKHFWAMPVWSYTDKSVMVLELVQKGILKSIKELAEDDDWGNPRNYDLVVNRDGEGLETEYSVKPKPAKDLDDDIKIAFANVVKAGFDLNELFINGDPFAPNTITEKTNDEINIDDIKF